METTKNKLSPYETIFFNKLSNYLDTKLYFFGSIQRYDYFPGISDIDVDIFTDNVSRTISQIQNYLRIDKNSTTKFIYKVDKKNSEYKIINGHKIEYEDPENSLSVEFSIYDEKFIRKMAVFPKLFGGIFDCPKASKILPNTEYPPKMSNSQKWTIQVTLFIS